MSKPIWIEAIEKVCNKMRDAGGVHFSIAQHELLVEIENRLKETPPPIVEAFAWTDSYGKLRPEIKLVSSAEALPVIPGNENKRYWLIEIPEEEEKSDDRKDPRA